MDTIRGGAALQQTQGVGRINGEVATRGRSIPESFVRLTDETNTLGSALAELFARLENGGILRPEPPSPAKAANERDREPDAACLLACGIDARRRELAGMTAALNDVMRRLEV